MTGSAADPLRRALWLNALGHQFRPILPPALANHCRLANVTDRRLVFLVDSPVWKAKLRLATPELLQLAASLGLSATDVAAKVTTQPLWAPQPETRHAPTGSAAAHKALAEVMASLDDTLSKMPAPDPMRRYRPKKP
jgi:hypothetical protein